MAQKDKEKTPIASSSASATSSQGQKSSAQSTISRLESKYSDILDRVAKRREKQRQQEKEDRDKTLEPDYKSKGPTSLMKSATTANIKDRHYFGATPKERTPFRLDRNKNKYNTDLDVKSKRSELSGLNSNANTSTYNGYESSYSKLKSTDSGYFDGRSSGKENIYKSKYDDLLSDISSRPSTTASSIQPYNGSTTSRQLRSYKKQESDEKHRTAINLYDLLDDDSGYKTGSRQQLRYGQRKNYTTRKSAGNALRSETQKFFEMEELENKAHDHEPDDPEKTDRENKRKEIQSLIMKYAQLDDFYSKTAALSDDTRSRDANNNKIHQPVATTSTTDINPWDSNGVRIQSPVVIPQKSNALAKSQTMANVPHYQSNYETSSWYNNYHMNGDYVPITTKTTSNARTSRSRMSKALSTFVRIS